MSAPDYHSLLARQLRKHFPGAIPPHVVAFLRDVNQAYIEADQDRNMLERALDIASEEMLSVNENLKLDMERRLSVERQFCEAKEKMLAAGRHEALGRLAANIAHDFNNILAIIRSTADVIEAAEAPDKTLIHEIQIATERGSGLTRQILAYAKNQRLNLNDCDLNGILKKYRLMLEAALGHGVSLRYSLSPAELTIRLDEDQFMQILVNMAVNARDAMQSSGEFIVRTACCSRDEILGGRIPANVLNSRGLDAVSGNCPPETDFVLLEFSDSGTGIGAEVLPKIFEPYFTTKDMGRGTGLGLSVVYGIVKQLQGFIFCSTIEGAGTTFYILFPRVAGVAATQEKREAAPLSEPKCIPEEIGILVVDDEKPLREAVAFQLRRERFRVGLAGSADEALAYLRNSGEKIDIIISDVTMPAKSGIQLAEEVARLLPRAKIIFMTGLAEQSAAPMGNARHFLQKPFSKDKLLASIFDLLKVA